ncbi:MAG: VCBS repeat-containing protein [Gammaproteobacteria bacterium]|nr:VCBS repeat-containing protein [Gammaproteobacteria bacterium]
MRAIPLAVIAAAFVAGCGGGGGGGGGTRPPPEPIAYTGSTAPLALTTGNSPDVAGGVWNALLIARAMAGLGIDVGTFTGDVDESRNGAQGGRVRVTGSLVDGLGELTVDFDAFRDGGVTIEGQFVERIDRLADAAGPDDVTVDIARLTFTGGFAARIATLAVSGQVVRRQRDYYPDAQLTVLANLVFRDEQSGEQGRLRDVRIERVAEVPPLGVRLVETYAGQVYDGQRGVVTLDSTGGVWFRDVVDEQPPYGGGALRIASGGSALRVRPVNADLVALLFDDTDDGRSDRSRLVRWDELIEGDVPASSGNRPPVPAAVSRDRVATGAPLVLEGFLHEDPDGDWLTTEWQLELAPVGSGATVSAAQSPESELTPPVPGDYLLTLRVTDGTHTVWDSARVTAADAPPAEVPAGTPIVVLRRPPDAVVNQALLLDARPSYSSRFDEPLSWTWKPPGSSSVTTDGLFSYTPTGAGLHVVTVEGCRTGYSFPCTTAEQVVSVGAGTRYFRPSNLGTGLVARQLAVGDFDGDGHQDLAVQSTTVGSGTRPPAAFVDVIYRHGAGYEIQQFVAPGEGRMASGDLSGDGRDDLAVIGPGTLTVARPGPPGAFFAGTFTLGPCGGGGATHLVDVVAITDANADDRADLIHLDSCSQELVTHLQNGDGSLAPPVAVPMPVLAGQLAAIGDLNGDKRADLLSGLGPAPIGSRGRFRVYLAQPDGSYIAGQEFALIDSGIAPSVAIGDVTGDGRNDAIAADDTRILVARQLPGGTLAMPDSYPAEQGSYGEQLLVADFNGDGRQDLRAQREAIFLQSAEGTLLPGYRLLGEVGPERHFDAPLPIDLNDDGLMDLVGTSHDRFREDSSGPIVLLGRPADD